MWTDNDFGLPTENRFLSLCNEEMARGGFQMASKRKRTNTGQSEGNNRAIFMLSSSDNKLNIIFDELLCVRKAQEKMNNGMLSFQNSFRTMGEGLTQVIHATNKHTDMLKTLAYKSIDLEARSRRNNLIFWGLCENYHENCFALIRDFIKNQFDLDSDKMYLARAHRLGARKNNNRDQRRPIVVNFRDYCDTETIMSRAYMVFFFYGLLLPYTHSFFFFFSSPFFFFFFFFFCCFFFFLGGGVGGGFFVFFFFFFLERIYKIANFQNF